MAPDVARRYDDLDDFNLDGLDDDPFRSPSPQPEQSQDPSKKRKSDGLGIDEEIDVTKRVRVPRIKLDESRLLSENGIPKLRKRAGNLKFKGKGHEVGPYTTDEATQWRAADTICACIVFRRCSTTLFLPVLAR